VQLQIKVKRHHLFLHLKAKKVYLLFLELVEHFKDNEIARSEDEVKTEPDVDTRRNNQGRARGRGHIVLKCF
jgi:hypothetical protein